MGEPRVLTDQQIMALRSFPHPNIEEFTVPSRSSEERYLRAQLVKLIVRSYDQRLFTSTQGTFSQRIDEQSFLITPHDVDRKTIQSEDIVRIENGRREQGKIPSKSVLLHQAIYDKYPDIHAVILAHPPNITAFAISDVAFDSRTIPESYILLREVVKVPFGSPFFTPTLVAEHCTSEHPILLVQNDCVLVTGNTALQAFDRLEVIEYSADAILASLGIGTIVPINDGQIREIELAFNLDSTM